MKTLRFFGVALLTVLMSVSFSACGGSDDDDNGGGGSSSSSIVGTWYWQTEKWYTDETMTEVSSEKTYTAETSKKTWTFTETGGTLYMFETSKKTGEKSNTLELKKTANNDYRWGNDRIIVKSISANKLVVDYYEDFYKEGYKPDYGSIILMK